MKKIAYGKMAKCSLAIFLVLSAQISFGQTKVFPNWSVFSSLEQLVGVDLETIIVKEKKQPLTAAEVNNFLNISQRAVQMMESGWAGEYLGFIKRVEAKVLFNDAIIISHQPNFYHDTALTNLALHYIDAGYVALNMYNPSIYPPYIIINREYAKGLETSATRQSVNVDESGVKTLRVEIAAAQGNVASALKELYTLWGNNQQLFALGNHDVAYSYTTAHRILQYNRMLQQYDNDLLNFCMNLLTYNISDDVSGSWRTGDDLARWNSLKQDLLQTLDLMLGQQDGSKKFGFSFPDENYPSHRFDWQFLIISRFDERNALENVLNFDIMDHAVFMDSTLKGTDAGASANRYAQKHFKDFLAQLHNGKDWGGKYYRAKWATSYMNKYGISDDDRKYLEKIFKKCHNLRGYN